MGGGGICAVKFPFNVSKRSSSCQQAPINMNLCVQCMVV